MTKREAQSAAKALLKRMEGKGWKARVWDNLGWNYCVELALPDGTGISVNPTGQGKSYFTLMGSSPGAGNGLWSYGQASNNPNQAVLRQLKLAYETLDRLYRIVEGVQERVKA